MLRVSLRRDGYCGEWWIIMGILDVLMQGRLVPGFMLLHHIRFTFFVHWIACTPYRAFDERDVMGGGRV